MFNRIVNDASQYLEQFKYVRKKIISGLFQNVINKICFLIIYI